jgi:hypothetical protein
MESVGVVKELNDALELQGDTCRATLHEIVKKYGPKEVAANLEKCRWWQIFTATEEHDR